jgi:hypothetical protein
VYVGTPNRVKALLEAESISVATKKLKAVVFDTKPNMKGFTIFETHETRDDTFALMIHSQKELLKRKLKVYMA